MPVFIWKGRTRQGTIKKGEMEAANEAAVMAQLRAQMLLPVTRQGEAEGRQRVPPVPEARDHDQGPRDLHAAVRDDDRRGPAARPVPRDPRRPAGATRPSRRSSARSSRTSSRARPSPTRSRKHPKLFDALYVNLVAAGEVGGILDTILNRLAVYLEKADALRRKVKGAMVYPTTVLVVAIGVVVLLLVKVIPTFEKMFEDFGGDAARADPGRREPQPLHAGVDRALHRGRRCCGDHRLLPGAQALAEVPAADGRDRRSSSRSSARCCARSPWRASPARSAP